MPRKRTSRTHSAHTVTLGAAVRELRACRDVSQEELGFRAKLHRNYVGAIERGEINPTFRTLRTLAEGLEVELSSLIRLCEEREEERGGAGAPPARERLRSSCR